MKEHKITEIVYPVSFSNIIVRRGNIINKMANIINPPHILNLYEVLEAMYGRKVTLLLKFSKN